MKSEYHWNYYGITGPFQILKGDRVVAIIHSPTENPNEALPIVAEVTRVFAKHQRRLDKESLRFIPPPPCSECGSLNGHSRKCSYDEANNHER